MSMKEQKGAAQKPAQGANTNRTSSAPARAGGARPAAAQPNKTAPGKTPKR